MNRIKLKQLHKISSCWRRLNQICYPCILWYLVFYLQAVASFQHEIYGSHLNFQSWIHKSRDKPYNFGLIFVYISSKASCCTLHILPHSDKILTTISVAFSFRRYIMNSFYNQQSSSFTLIVTIILHCNSTCIMYNILLL